MFDLNFIAKPGIQSESTEACWSFSQSSIESETKGAIKSSVIKSKKSGTNWKDYGIILFAVVIIVVISMFVNSQPKVSQDIVLNQVMDLFIDSGYMEDLQLTEAHFKPDFVKVTITASDLKILQDFTQRYNKEDNITYKIFQKNDLNYVSLDFPWEGDKKRGDFAILKTLADKTVFSKNISINFTKDEFELQGQSTDIISYLLQMADNGLVQKFTFSILQLESGRFYLKVRTNKP